MKEPWTKTGGWPRAGTRGKSWQLGFRDHEGRARSRSFKTKNAAEAWSREYVDAERRNRLREFLLGTDAPEVQPDNTPLAELIIEWLATDAHPDSPGGLAPATWDSYRSLASRHILGNATMLEMKRTKTFVEVAPAIKPLGENGGYAIGHRPVAEFAAADTLKRWVDGMRSAGVGDATEAKAWKVLSSALSWAVDDDRWPVSANGCAMMQRRRGMRRASRRAGTGASRARQAGKRRSDLSAWALSPLAVERVRLVMLERVERRGALFPLRDATALSIQYGLAMRNQEIWALSVGDLAGTRARVREVLSYKALDDGKTPGATSTARRPRIDKLLADDIKLWLKLLAAHGYPVGAEDFLLRGDLGGHGAPDGHMTGSQAHKWGPKYLKPAVEIVAKRWPKDHGEIVGATPYSLRRGAISLMIRAGEDRQVIAQHCGTSVEMLERSYSFAIEDLEDEGPRPVEKERQRAREMSRSKAKA